MIITRTYDSHVNAQEAVNAVKRLGVPADAISVIASRDHMESYDSDMSSSSRMTTDGMRSDPDRHEITEVDTSTATGTGAGVGGVIGGGAGLLTGLGLMAIPGVGPLVAAGWLATTAAGAAVGAAAGAATGGVIGMLTDSGIPERDAHTYAESVRRGGVLVSVRADGYDEAAITSALDSHDPADLTMRRDAWEQEGWTKYDPGAMPYTSDQIRSEQARYR
jgi:hypothetical protein